MAFCVCEQGWAGEACRLPSCRGDCGGPEHGHCDLTGEKSCVCNGSWQGPDCSLPVPSPEAFWGLPSIRPWAPSLGRASHRALVHSGLMWVVGGYSFNYSSYHMVLSYDLETSRWEAVPVNSSGPLYRYGHSLALHQDDIIMFGGKLEAGPANITDELWVFNIPTRTWSPRQPSGPPPPPALEGHTAHVVAAPGGEPVMLTFFGYSPLHGYSSQVQEYNIRSGSWRLVAAGGAAVAGGYGHTSVHVAGAVYVHGGYGALGGNKHGPMDHLYRYHIGSRTWMILRGSGSARYLHSAVLLGGKMLLFGGNTHNDTSLSNGAKCFSSDFLAYDLACDEWTVLDRPDLHRDSNRFGHSAVVGNGSMLVFGGFSGVLLGDVLAYTPPSCGAFLDPVRCVDSNSSVRCRWENGRCLEWESEESNRTIPDPSCPPRPDGSDEDCFRFSDCSSCTSTSRGCQWCQDQSCISASSNCTVLTLELARPHGGALSLAPPPSMLSEQQLSLWKHGGRRRGHAVRESWGCRPRGGGDCPRRSSCRSCSLGSGCQWEPHQQQCRALPGDPCGGGWQQVGGLCLRLNSSRQSYDNAQHYCKNLGGNTASLLTNTQLDFILQELNKPQTQRLSPWVGLRKINVSYWGWEDSSPFSNSSGLHWLPGEPSDSGFCALLERNPAPGLKANPCTAPADGLICEKPVGSPQSGARPCRTPCSLRGSCSDCTGQASECMWCRNTRRCVESSAYVVSFPYGQCMEWQTQDCTAQNCSGLRTCADCLQRVECGWCGDPSDTGRGACMEGSYRGPLRPAGPRPGPRDPPDMVLDQGLCPSDRGFNWAFIQCPACQCNGHSRCVRGVCERCGNLTAGDHCQSCQPGFYGDPTNGGRCSECQCNSHAGTCHAATGKCFCSTKGIRGDQCQLCDSENRYLGNPLRGTCYYNLLIDYQFTFSLLQEDDRYYSAINFMATPEQANKNLDMSINASNNFDLNITWSLSSTAGSVSGEEMPIVARTSIKEHRDSFSCEKFNFRLHHNLTFYIYLSNFSWPIKIQIAFSQHNNIMDLVQFFVTFFSCFLSLLLVAAVVWKIKQTCWASRRRELMRERQQMASRPFASVAVALEVGGAPEEPMQAAPKPIAMETCWGGRAGVLTVLLYLPRIPSGIPPPGQSGLAIGSVLVDAVQQQRGGLDFRGLKHRKHNLHQGTCV
ncbi:attractin-like protein 1 isoform 2-T2 [Menidia menidia]